MQTFRGVLNSWDSYSIVITSLSKEAAEEQAQRLCDDVGPEAFKHRDCGTDFIEADLCPRQWDEPPNADAPVATS